MNDELQILTDRIDEQNRTIRWRTIELRDCAEDRDRYEKRMCQWREIARAYMGEPTNYSYTRFGAVKYWLVKLLVRLVMGKSK